MNGRMRAERSPRTKSGNNLLHGFSSSRGTIVQATALSGINAATGKRPMMDWSQTVGGVSAVRAQGQLFSRCLPSSVTQTPRTS